MKKKGMKSKRRGKERKRKVKVEGAMTLFNLEISTSSPGRFSQALGAGREKALASAGHMTTKHPAFVGVIN